MESINIKVVVEKCAQKDATSFAELYEFLVDRIFTFVSYRTNDKTAATEVTQDVFIELHKALFKFKYKSDAEFYGFVFTIVRRQLAKYYLMNNKHRTSEVDETSLTDNAPNIELINSVRSALEKLDERSREIVVLHHWSRFTFAEIANIINMTESAVRVRHHRAKTALASILNT
jgi:RNA polymerase sigma-70 factor (ECF subfamily)